MAKLTSVIDTTMNWTQQRGIPIVFNNETGSTNDDAKKAALNENDDFVLYLADHQTAGRGRGTNTWLDTGSGESLLSTWSYFVTASPQSITAPRIGLALFRTVNAVWPSLSWSLKAPNDLFLDGRKVAGLLVESVSDGSRFRLLIGLGFNILNHPRRFNDAEHLSKTLQAAPEDGEWFQFLDELNAELGRAGIECLNPTLSDAACRELLHALNANSAKTFTTQQITPHGDLIHSKGKLRWLDL